MRGTRGCRSGRRATRATTIAGTRTARTLQAIKARRVAQQRLVDQAGRRNGADGRDGRRCSASFGTMADARPGKARRRAGVRALVETRSDISPVSPLLPVRCAYAGQT